MADLTKTNPLNRWNRETAQMLAVSVEVGLELLGQVPRVPRCSQERAILVDLALLALDLGRYFRSKGWV